MEEQSPEKAKDTPSKTETFKASLFHVLKKVSFFRSSVPLNIRGNRKVATTLGGAVSIALVVFLLVQGIRYTVDMFERDSVRIYQIQELEEDPQLVTLNTTDHFFLAAYIAEVNGGAVNLSETSPVAFQASFVFAQRTDINEKMKAKSKYPAYWAPCNRSDIPAQASTGDPYTSYSLAYGYCLSKINFTDPHDGTCPQEIIANYPDCVGPWDLPLKGTYMSEEFAYFQLNLVPCNESSASRAYNMKCDPDISEKQFEINLYYTNTLIDPKNYQTPNRSVIDTNYWSFSEKLFKIVEVYVDRIVVQNYDDFISASLNHNQTFYGIQTEKMREIETLRLVNTKALMQFNLRRSNVNIVTVRSYSTLTTVLIRVGGFSKSLMFIAAFIVLGYMRYKYLMILSNELYNFKLPTPSQQNVTNKGIPNRAKIYVLDDIDDKTLDSRTTPITPLTPCSPFSSFSPNSESNAVIKNYFNTYKKKNLNYGELRYFKNFLDRLCRKTTQEEQIAAKARQLVLGDIDIVKIIRKVNEIDKIKLVIFTQDQRAIFDSYEKPLVCLNQKKKLVHLNTYHVHLRAAKEHRARKTARHPSQKANDLDIEKKVLQDREEFDSLSKYAKLYVAYRELKKDTEPQNQKFNQRLLIMIGKELLDAFERMDQILGDNTTPDRFERIVNRIMADPKEESWHSLV